MKSIGLLLPAEVRDLRTATSAQKKRSEAKLGSEIASHHVQAGCVSAMGIIQHNLFESGTCKTGTDIAQYGHKRLR